MLKESDEYVQNKVVKIPFQWTVFFFHINSKIKKRIVSSTLHWPTQVHFIELNHKINDYHLELIVAKVFHIKYNSEGGIPSIDTYHLQLSKLITTITWKVQAEYQMQG